VANQAQSAPALFDADTLAPTFDTETLRLFEIGSKNRFFVGDVGITFNVSAFFNDYQDLQQTTLTSTAQILEFEGIDLPEDVIDETGLGGQIVAFTFNAADAEIYGAQFDGGFDLPFDVGIDYTVLWLPGAKITESQEIQDSRFQADVDPDNAVNRSIDGNRLMRTPEVQFSGSISKAVQFDWGQIDGIFSVGYQSSQFMTIFNGIDFNNPDDPEPRLNDRVDGFWNFDIGAGVSIGTGDKPWRIEAYGSNLTNKQQPEAIIITQFDNTRFFNAPRLYGARLRKRF